MHPSTRMRRSRASWREKAVKRATESRELRKTVGRRDARIEQLEDQLKSAATSQSFSPDPVPTSVALPTADETQAHCVVLAITAVISFRSVPRVLALIAGWFFGNQMWIPHFTSVINWTLRVGLSRLRRVVPLLEEAWIAVIDASIDVGVKKVLVVLRVRLAALAQRGGALTLADAECIGIEVSESWTGKTVAAALGRIFDAAGKPLAILKDQGGDLALGVKLWKEAHEAASVKTVDDVGHAFANALKAMFASLKAFQRMLVAVASGAAKLRQSELAALTPPKIRTKGRFQSISRVVEWSERILDIIGGSGRAEEGSLTARLRAFFPGFGVHRPILERLARCTKIINEALEILKDGGLDNNTYEAAKARLKELPWHCVARPRVLDWLERQMQTYRDLAVTGSMPVSSDIIETLFGKFKSVLARNPKAEFNRIVLAIPCLCGKLDEAIVYQGLGEVTHRELRDWEAQNVIDTQCRQRRQLFAKTEDDVDCVA